jgi:hypothetical protein
LLSNQPHSPARGAHLTERIPTMPKVNTYKIKQIGGDNDGLILQIKSLVDYKINQIDYKRDNYFKVLEKIA